MRKQILKIYFLLAIFFTASNFASAGTTDITTCQDLNIANEIYVLQNDVSSDGTCFKFAANGITLDVSDKTVTYADLEFTGVENPGFEEGEPGNPLIPPGWDLSGAHGNAHRQDYTQQLFFDTHSLRIDNIAGDANAEEYVLSSPVYLPVAGKYALTAEVKGGPYGAFTSHLEIDGIAVTCGNTISNMHLSATTDMSWGLICEFTITQPATVRGKVVLGTIDVTRNTNLNVDEVDIRPIGLYGITNSVSNKSMAEIKGAKDDSVDVNTENIDPIGDIDIVVSKKGGFIEGRSKAIYSAAVKNVGDGVNIHDLKLITNGINSENINEYWNGNLDIHDNYMEANGKLPLNRQFMFSNINLGATFGGNVIYNNTIKNSPHVGIYHAGTNPAHSEIYRNLIQTRITATNGFSITAGGNVDIHDNVITPIQGHGIGLSASSDNVNIYNNRIEPSSWPCSEYSTYVYPNSAHGIRIKNYASGSINNLEINNNIIIGHANPQLSNCYTEVSGITNYLDDDSGGGPASTNVKIHDNQISVETDNYLQQHAMAYKGMGQGEFYNNTLTSNHIVVDLSDNDVGGADQYKIFDSNTLIKGANQQGFYTLRYGYKSVANNTFTNTILQNGADLEDISFGINNGSNSIANYAVSTDFTADWYLGINAKNDSNAPLSGVAVEIRDKDDNLLRTLSTDASGNVFDKLSEYVFAYKNTTTKGYAYLSPYSIVLMKTGYKDLTVPLTLDSSKYLYAEMKDDASTDSSSYTIQTITNNPGYNIVADITAPSAPSGLAVM